jgi:hypothetical protein
MAMVILRRKIIWRLLTVENNLKDYKSLKILIRR